jgi:toxin YoeB
VSWTVLFTKQAQKDARKLASASAALQQKAQALLDLLAVDPYQQPPPDAALVGELRGACSRRITIQHRLFDQVLEEERIVKVLRLWSHDASTRCKHQVPGSSRNARMVSTPVVGCSGNEPRRAASWGSRSRTLQRGTSSAMGLPRRVITMASPASNASSRLESWVLASATVTCSMTVDHLDDQIQGGV